MGHDDTPAEELQAHRRANAPDGGVDPVWFREWRRDLKDQLDSLRRESREAFGDMNKRLLGIEGKMAESEHTTGKHDEMIAELAQADAEHHQRIEKLEREGGSDLFRRVKALEASDEVRSRVEGAARAVAEAAAAAPTRKLLASLMDGGARSLGPIVVGFLTWLVLTYARGLPTMRQAETPPAPPATGAAP